MDEVGDPEMLSIMNQVIIAQDRNDSRGHIKKIYQYDLVLGLGVRLSCSEWQTIDSGPALITFPWGKISFYYF